MSHQSGEWPPNYPRSRRHPIHPQASGLLPDDTFVDTALNRRLTEGDVLLPEQFEQHNEYCIDDWRMYHGAGPRGMGPNGDGCVCALAPADYEDDKLQGEIIQRRAEETGTTDPRLWDERPDAVVHIAGACVNLFGRYMRQRCEWCGIVLMEYDLQMVAVPVDQPGPPGNWEPGSLVRIDGNMSVAIDNPQMLAEDVMQLPPDACTFDPKTQVGAEAERPSMLVRSRLFYIPGLSGVWRRSGMRTTGMGADGKATIDFVRVD